MTKTIATRGKKRCHSESSVQSQAIKLHSPSLPEVVGSADEDDNNYFDLYNGSYDDDDVFTPNITVPENHQGNNSNSTITLNELSSCLEKIQNCDNVFEEIDYKNLFATVEATNDVDIDKLIHSKDYDQDEFVPFEYVKKLLETDTMVDCGAFNQSTTTGTVEQFAYGIL